MAVYREVLAAVHNALAGYRDIRWLETHESTMGSHSWAPSSPALSSMPS